MQAVKIDTNIVIVANQFNPSIIDRLWLVRHQVLTEDDFLEGSISVPIVSQVRSKHFNLTVLPDQLQFSPIKEIDAPADVVRIKLGLIVDKLPETPYTAIGANFTWQALQFAFNFHVDLIPENKIALIHEMLAKWETAGNLAESIVTGVIEEYKAF